MSFKNDRVRVLTPGGILHRYVSQKQAAALLFIKRGYDKRGNRHRLFSIKDREAAVNRDLPPAALKTVEREKLAQTWSTHVLLRVTKDGRFRRWDPNLNQQDLKDGRFTAAETIRQRAAKKAEEKYWGRWHRTGLDDFEPLPTGA
jgi:hypothetical protein